MRDLTLLLNVDGTNLGIKAVFVERGEGVPNLFVKSPPEFVKLDELKRLGSFEHNYRCPIFPEQAIQRVIDDLEGRTSLLGYKRSPVTHLVYHGAESHQIEDRVPVTFFFSAYGQSTRQTEPTHL